MLSILLIIGLLLSWSVRIWMLISWLFGWCCLVCLVCLDLFGILCRLRIIGFSECCKDVSMFLGCISVMMIVIGILMVWWLIWLLFRMCLWFGSLRLLWFRSGLRSWMRLSLVVRWWCMMIRWLFVMCLCMLLRSMFVMLVMLICCVSVLMVVLGSEDWVVRLGVCRVWYELVCCDFVCVGWFLCWIWDLFVLF